MTGGAVSELLLEAVAAPYANADPPTSVSLIYMHVIFEKQDISGCTILSKLKPS
jgi:hypothetical protein